MSVLIKGAAMPKDCDSCLFGNVIACPLWKPMNIGERHPDCPLVDIKTPHGDLMDRDEFLKRMNVAIAMMSGMMKAIDAEDDKEMQMELKAYRDIRDGIKDCDTVIEAEGECGK